MLALLRKSSFASWVRDTLSRLKNYVLGITRNLDIIKCKPTPLSDTKMLGRSLHVALVYVSRKLITWLNSEGFHPPCPWNNTGSFLDMCPSHSVFLVCCMRHRKKCYHDSCWIDRAFHAHILKWGTRKKPHQKKNPTNLIHALGMKYLSPNDMQLVYLMWTKW